jgi:hypothetical protein
MHVVNMRIVGFVVEAVSFGHGGQTILVLVAMEQRTEVAPRLILTIIMLEREFIARLPVDAEQTAAIEGVVSRVGKKGRRERYDGCLRFIDRR